MSQIKAGRYLRWYANGSAVGIGLMKMLKPDVNQGLDKVLEAGNPDVFEYVKKVPETSLTFEYSVISYAQLAAALGQTNAATGQVVTTTSGYIGEVPPLPDNFDIVERMITPGTEGTATETYQGFVIYQGIQTEKESWDAEVDKVLAVNLTAKCKRPRRFVNITGIQFDKFIPNGVLTAFVFTQKAKQLNDGYYTIRGENPFGTKLKETVDFTIASSSSTTTATFGTAPASTSASSILFIYIY